MPQMRIESMDAHAGVESPQSTRRKWRVSVHPLVQNFGLAGMTSLLTSIAAMIVISLIGRRMGPVLLGEYLLVRRMASWMQAVVVLPSGIALPRYVAASVNEGPSTRQEYFVTALVIGCGLAILLMIALLVWRGSASRLMFGNSSLGCLTLPLGLLLLGLAAQSAAFGFYQGILSMSRACLLQLFNLAIFPVAVVVWLADKNSVSLIIDATAIAMIITALVFSVPLLGRLKLKLKTSFERSSELLSFGLSRTWGDFGLQALLSLPAVIAAHYLPMNSVSFLLLGGSFLAVVAAATLPVGIVLLSQVTRSLAQNRTAQLKLQITQFVDALVELSMFISLQMLVFTDSLVLLWVGDRFSAGVRIVQILILAVPFYFVYGGLRSVIDAAALKAHNTRNVLTSLAIFVAGVVIVLHFWRGSVLEGLSISVVLSIAVLACLTVRTVRRLLDVRVDWLRLLPGIALALILGIVSFLVHGLVHFEKNLCLLVAYELVVSATYFAGLWLLGSRWMRYLAQTALSLHAPRVINAL